MKIAVLGAAGFIGTNLIRFLMKDNTNDILAVDESIKYFDKCIINDNVHFYESKFDTYTNFKTILSNQDLVYHLISTNNPTLSNQNIGKDIANNVIISINILDACIANNVNKVVFISSGGTVYGDKVSCPIKENEVTNPINTYGIQKLTIEKLFYLYNHMYSLNYSIIRLSNPYGPYQRPNGRLGVITTFVYKALNNEELIVYGDGSVIRDYIYIDDAIQGIVNIANSNNSEKIFNLGSGKGVSINQVIDTIRETVGKSISVDYIESRSVDVPINILDISKYVANFDVHTFKSLKEGIKLTINHFKNFTDMED